MIFKLRPIDLVIRTGRGDTIWALYAVATGGGVRGRLILV